MDQFSNGPIQRNLVNDRTIFIWKG